MKLGGECGIGGYVVKLNAQNDDAAILKSTVLVAEPATFACSTQRINLGIEPQKNFAATQR